ncbi:DUF2569 family protein [Neobacillus dielmonensis]|uniref:DUF2569 family protein n=1 Tax=Neobacillus dielmonensis TaxID=1347369 RepID=UPI0005A8B04E|nr:DUF2569 family protein [Neobacillus dielmonensis]
METEKPIEGWLFILGLRMVGGFIYGLVTLYGFLDNVTSFDFDTFVSEYSRDIANVIFVQTFYPFFSVIINLIMDSFLIYLFFTKNKEFPKAFIYLNITILVLAIGNEFVIALSGEIIYFVNPAIGLVLLIIWGTYLLRSQRVKETFIHSKRKKYVKITEEEYELIKQKLSNS